MALQGTLDTFALPDVLRLLATTSKTGQLVVQGDRGSGSLRLDGGAVVGGDTSLADTTESHEVLFELLRLDDGSFVFDQETSIAASGPGVDVATVIEAAEAAHAEWLDLSTVVPSLDVGIALADDLPDDTTTIDRERWKLIVTIGSGTTVRSLGERLGLTELPVLRAARSLVDDGLATIDEPADGPGPDPFDVEPSGASQGFDDDGPSAGLPSLDDEPDVDGLFVGADAALGDLPEPLPEGSGGAH